MNNQLPTLALYHKDYCPFCAVTRRAIDQLELEVELRDTEFNKKNRDELLKEGGKRQVPSLRIEDTAGNVEWLYESMDIIEYLRKYKVRSANAA